jgi:pimeloyl-ACP methyl ester carboxylesterase
MERFSLSIDGRRLDVEVAGPAGGEPLIFHLGTPSSATVYPALVELGAQRGMRHISWSRPGYSRSERLAGRTVADCIVDLEAVAAELGIDRFHAVGWSGGGPHALACAALLPRRTIAAATIAGVAPREAAGLDWLAGMGQENLVEFAAAQAGPEQLQAYLELGREMFRAVTGAEVHAAFGELLSPVDRAALTGEFAEYMAALARDGLAEGIWGWFDDDVACMTPWGFSLDAIERPVAVWQGSEDRFVPYSHGRWLADNVSGATPRLLEGEGHISILLGAYGQLLDELLAAG